MRIPTSPLQAFHPSNALTYASLLAGVGAIASALTGSAAGAGVFIAIAVILDTFDGRFARRFRRSAAQRAIGVQVDSLSDAIAFGCAPVACLGILWGPAVTASAAGGATGPLWWAAAFVYAACAITRLAFFNITHETQDGFVGLPVPVAALIAATALLFHPGIAASTTLLGATAIAMVAPLPIPRPKGAGLAAFVAWPVLVIVAHVT